MTRYFEKKDFLCLLIPVIAIMILMFAAASPAYADISSGLVGHWTLDDTSGIDASGLGNHAYVTNGATSTLEVVDGRVGNAVRFNGGAYFLIPDTPSLTATSAITVSAWSRRATTSLTMGVVSRQASTYWSLVYTSGDELRAFLNGSFMGIWYTDNQWYLQTLTYDGATVKLYINGVLKQTTAHATAVSTTSDIRIGSVNSAGSKQMYGEIDDVRIYDRALSPSDVQELLALGDSKTLYYSPTGDDVTGEGTIGNPWQTVGLDSLIQGDTYILREGTYNSTGIVTQNAKGTPDKPITVKAYPGEEVTIQGVIDDITWEPYGGDVYRSVSTVAYGDDSRIGGQFMGVDGTWHALIQHPSLAHLTAATHNHAAAGYYLGPGIFWNSVDSKLYIRLTKPDPSAVFRDFASLMPPSLDPSAVQLRIFRGNTGLQLKNAEHVELNGISIDGYETALDIVTSTSTIVTDATFTYSNYGILSNSSTTVLTVERVVFNVFEPPWVAWGDVKQMETVPKKSAIQAHDADGLLVQDCVMNGVFDGITGSGNDIRFIGNVVRVWDDTFQLHTDSTNVEFSGNMIFGPFVSHNGAGESSLPGTTKIFNNVIVAKEQLFGRNDPEGLVEDKYYNWESHNVFPSHAGSGTGRGNPWHIANNTMYVESIDPNNHGTKMRCYGNCDIPGVFHDVVNNIVYQGSDSVILREMDTDGNERYDYNLYYREAASPVNPLFTEVLRNLRTSTSSYLSLDLFRASADFIASQNVYAPGWETNGIEANPQLLNGSASFGTSTDFHLTWESPAIDVGSSTSYRTTDFYGNPIYGTPDIGAIEYQPPYVIGTHDVPATGAIRLYADGKFRERVSSTTAAMSDLAVTPQGGWGSGDYREYMDLQIDAWTATSMAWTATSSIATTTVFTMGGLTPNGWYTVQLDAATSSSIVGATCTNSVCQANGSGVLAFTYSGSWSTHSFEVTPGSNPNPTSGGGVCLNCGSGSSRGGSSSSGITTTPSGTSAAETNGSGSAPSAATSTPFRCAETAPVTDGLSGAGLVNLLVSLSIIPSGKAKTACDALTSAATAPSAPAPAVSSSFRFSAPLAKGTRSDEVRRLQQFLNTRGFVVTTNGLGSPGNETNLFGLLTEDAVKRFQAAYAAEILAPVGLTDPTGYWGQSSIRKANALLSQ